MRAAAAGTRAGRTLGTGGGVTVRSDVEDEWQESRWKAERLLRALEEESPG